MYSTAFWCLLVVLLFFWLYCVATVPGGTPIHYLYGYVAPNGVVILERGIHFRGVF